ncbi:extended synaptotagmin-1-like [Tripterygium wilfordii]|uniref:Extended synaptotagmin-1-like n=1 Tax=Tripterygium wilfordii TaxID=458696 RepID=A0A7J7C292_TRIWF|nr:FT-interacting protein 3-like [Tripterygium wilfordii]KAF5727967.1 extended synaptotagmin-1-like [Tripterygium wilfordii]
MEAKPKATPVDDSLKETSPNIGGGRVTGGEKLTTSYDLVEQMHFLYVRIAKAQNLMLTNTMTCNPFVEVKIGNYKARTGQCKNAYSPEWNQVFAFEKGRIQATSVEIVVRDKEYVSDDFIGKISISVSDIPTRVPPDSAFSPEWRKLEGKNQFKDGELLMVLWYGTQADEEYTEAWHPNTGVVSGESMLNTFPRVYLSPKLWYLRVIVAAAQDLVLRDRGRKPEVFFKAILGDVVLRSKISDDKSVNPKWKENMIFVAAEPFKNSSLILSVEDKVGPNKEECLGRLILPMDTLDTRKAPGAMSQKWYNLKRDFSGPAKKQDNVVKFASKLQMTVYLDGTYHVFDEPAYYSSDLRPTSKTLWPRTIGVLELGILSAEGLVPMKNRGGFGATDAYCVAKYGPKWVRTRTVFESFAPKWNEQYTFEVYDLCTFITIAVFDNCHLQAGDEARRLRDRRIGKVRIRLSTLETDRIYTHSYPLLVLLPNGMKKMGAIQLAVRLTCPSMNELLASYTRPLLPKMHYIQPLSVHQLDILRHQAAYVLCQGLRRNESPLRKEVVEYMLDTNSHVWSLRKAKANAKRLNVFLDSFAGVKKWFDKICQWKNPVTSFLVCCLFAVIVCHPQLVLPTLSLYLVVVGIKNYRKRPRHPPHMDAKLSHADVVSLDELDEEFDPFPTAQQGELLRMRYDRLRSIAQATQAMIGDLATQGERMQSLLSWRDPRATFLFVNFCLIAGIVFYVIPLRLLIIGSGWFVMRPPRVTIHIPPIPMNFFHRMPTKLDSMM